MKVIEKKIFEKELKRYKEFADMAKNKVYCKKIIDKIEEEHGIFW